MVEPGTAQRLQHRTFAITAVALAANYDPRAALVAMVATVNDHFSQFAPSAVAFVTVPRAEALADADFIAVAAPHVMGEGAGTLGGRKPPQGVQPPPVAREWLGSGANNRGTYYRTHTMCANTPPGSAGSAESMAIRACGTPGLGGTVRIGNLTVIERHVTVPAVGGTDPATRYTPKQVILRQCETMLDHGAP
eukprot:gene12193-2680_t